MVDQVLQNILYGIFVGIAATVVVADALVQPVFLQQGQRSLLVALVVSFPLFGWQFRPEVNTGLPVDTQQPHPLGVQYVTEQAPGCRYVVLLQGFHEELIGPVVIGQQLLEV